MQGRLFQGLNPVRRRQQGVLVMRAAVLGLLVSSVAGIGLGVWRWLTGGSISPQSALAILAAGPVLGALAGLLWKRGWHSAAVAVDAHCRLKDRSATALDFVRRSSGSALHQLQVSDAEEHLTGISPQEIVPLRMPRALPFACGALVVALALLTLPLTSKKVAAGPTAPLPEIVAQAEAIAEDLKQLDELAKSERNKELEQLVEQLREKVEEMKQPGVDLREALAKLSEMQAAIAAQQAQYNVGLVDAQLSSLGEAMTPAPALEAAGKALMEAKFDKAAEQLDKMEMPDVDRKEARAVEEKMKQVAQAMGDVGLGQLGTAASDMAEGLKSGHKGRFQQGTKMLAQLTKNHNSRRKIKEILDAEFDELEGSKEKCDCENTTRIRKPEKTNSPSQDWGAGISGNVVGNKTNMKTNHELKEITGTPGDGPSETETTHSPEGRQLAGRGYKEAYQKYRKMSEAVLDSEPIPLGHRQTIRKYFELIRPQNLDADPTVTPKKDKDGQ
jgi:hypothetical protein